MIDYISAYHGIDWLAFTCMLTAYILVGRKNKWGFVIQIIGHIAWLYIAYITAVPGMMVANIVFALVVLYNFFNWHTKKI